MNIHQIHAAIVLAFLALSTPLLAAEPADKWEKAIADFEAQDRQSPPPKNAILFVGSSSIRLWDLNKSFPDLPAINRGFGGSQMSDVVRYASRIVTPYKPRAIVLYEGDNDLANGRKPEEVAADFDAFLKLVRADLPETPMIVIGCKPSPKRWALIDQQRTTNRLLAERCTADGHCTFLDVEKPMLGDDGQPRADLFVEDKLHLNDKGYELWTKLLEPLLNAKIAN